MTDLILRRDPSQHGFVTFGVLSLGGFQTLELPFVPWTERQDVVWASGTPPPDYGGDGTIEVVHAGGMPGRSCVPPGIYQLERHNTPTHPFTWALVNPLLGVWHAPTDVPDGQSGRSEILIHPGNTALDSKGCILLGLERTHLFTTPGVLSSQKAFEQLRANLPWVDGHTLTIMGEGATTT